MFLQYNNNERFKTLIPYNLALKTLRRILAHHAESRAVKALSEIYAPGSPWSVYEASETEILHTVQETLVPAYRHGWLTNVVTIEQLNQWILKQAAFSFADPLLQKIGLINYWKLQSMLGAAETGVIDRNAFLMLCPVAPIIYTDFFTNQELDAWRPNASKIQALVKAMDIQNQVEYWLHWLSHQDIEPKELPLV